jgi:hypothetical protein
VEDREGLLGAPSSECLDSDRYNSSEDLNLIHF